MRMCLPAVLLSCAAAAGVTAQTPARGPDATGQASAASPPGAWTRARRSRSDGTCPNRRGSAGGRALRALDTRARSSGAIRSAPRRAVSGTPDPKLKVGPLRRHRPVQERVAPLARAVLRQDERRPGRGTARPGASPRQAPPKSSHANSTLAPTGSTGRVLRLRRALLLRPERRALWKKDFGSLDSGFFLAPEAQWGFASSPVIHEGAGHRAGDVQKDSFLAALDVTDGQELWRTPRADVPTWGTPAVVDEERARRRSSCNGWKQIGGYDLETGKELWRMTGGGDIPVPTPVVAHGWSSSPTRTAACRRCTPIRPTATGDISLKDGETANEHVAWSSRATAHYMQTPIVVGDMLYVLPRQRRAERLRREDGQAHYRQRLGDGDGFTASPVAAGEADLLHQRGRRRLRRQGRRRRTSSWPTNPLGEVAMATPAISEASSSARAITWWRSETADGSLSITPGAQLGAFHVLGLLGQGGMGTVYRARDNRLKRDVALKVLPDAFAADPERVARFQREAEILASLTHHNIAAIYGLEDSGGVRALVMELVSGPDFGRSHARGAIPIEDALPYRESSLPRRWTNAHEKGALHRDLKPANIKIHARGARLKVLDFGLAKALGAPTEPGVGPSPDHSPTITSPAFTQAGTILGTAAYMAPEQVRGRGGRQACRHLGLWLRPVRNAYGRARVPG